MLRDRIQRNPLFGPLEHLNYSVFHARQVNDGFAHDSADNFFVFTVIGAGLRTRLGHFRCRAIVRPNQPKKLLIQLILDT